MFQEPAPPAAGLGGVDDVLDRESVDEFKVGVVQADPPGVLGGLFAVFGSKAVHVVKNDGWVDGLVGGAEGAGVTDEVFGEDGHNCAFFDARLAVGPGAVDHGQVD